MKLLYDIYSAEH